MDVEILIPGWYKFDKNKRELDYSSTVVYIPSEKVLVDTGHYAVRNLLKEKLEKIKVKYLVLTHLHLDHSANFNLVNFEEMYFYFCPFFNPEQIWIRKLKEGKEYLLDFQESFKITNKIELLYTPGHTPDHCSVIYYSQEGNYIICGDAIPLKKCIDMDVKLCWNLEKFRESKRKILSIADYLIFGHEKEIYKVK